MNKRNLQILILVFAIALTTVILAENRPQEGVWKIGPRLLPASVCVNRC